MSDAVAWAIVVPLAGAALSAVAPPRVARWLAAATAALTLLASAAVVHDVASHGARRHPVGGYGPPLGIELYADGLAAAMLLAIAVVALLVGLAALDAAGDARRGNSLAALYLFAWAALDALVLSADVFNLYVTLELTTLATVALVGARGERPALTAGVRYLLVALPGSLVYLLGVALLYGAHATLDLGALATKMASGPTASIALALMTMGLCLKAALFPLHGFLPPAYVGAPPVVTAFLAGLVGKSPFYVLVRLWLAGLPPDFADRAGVFVGVLGAAAILWGSLAALGQARLKALVAYSSVAQIGYFFLLFPIGTPDALRGGVYLALTHAAAKAAMFLAAGTVERAVGRDDVGALEGVAHHLPVTFFTLALSGVALMGMPPGGGFVGKWLLVRAAIETGAWWWAVVILVGGLLAAAYVFRVLRGAFLPLPPGSRFRPTPRGPELVALALALLSLLLGIAPNAPLDLLALRSLS